MTDDFIRPVVNDLKEYVPGKTPKEPGVIKLASNENPFGPSPKAVEAIAKESKNLQIYPDQKSILLREALAKKLEIGEDRIIAGNGSDEIMQLAAATFLKPGEEVVIPANTFSLYELFSRIFDGKPVMVPLKDQEQDLAAMVKAITPRTKMIFLCNPHNPTGSMISRKALHELLNKVPEHVLVIIDEAYMEFADPKVFPESISYVLEGKNVLVLRTFSKFYGLAGLRVGYGIARPELIRFMFRVKPPFNVSRLAQAGAVAALSDKKFLDKTLKNNLEVKKALYAGLDKLGLKYKKTESNFVLINLGKSADQLFVKMMRERIIIRPLTSFGLPEAIRISIGTKEQNERFISSLKNCL
jgi:histidinol-phosphate aminotransferase